MSLSRIYSSESDYPKEYHIGLLVRDHEPDIGGAQCDTSSRWYVKQCVYATCWQTDNSVTDALCYFLERSDCGWMFSIDIRLATVVSFRIVLAHPTSKLENRILAMWNESNVTDVSRHHDEQPLGVSLHQSKCNRYERVFLANGA